MRGPPSPAARSVFVDTSAFIAAIDRRDQWHVVAREAFELLGQERVPLCTSNLVVAEGYVLMARWLGYNIAIRWLRGLEVNLVFQDTGDHEPARAVLARHQGRDLSYVDAVSFVMMERLGIPTAFTFDEHFRQYGVAVLP